MGLHGSGTYIVIEGGETSGKSSLAGALAERYRAVLTRETGGTRVGTQIRSLLHDTDHTELFWLTEALLAGADRAQHIHEVVAPALTRGRNVVSDRSWISSVVYQALANDQDPEIVLKITEIAIGEFMNIDELLVLDIPWSEYLRRQTSKGYTDRFESMGNEYHRKVLEGYLAIARDLGALVIDASLPISDVFELATAKIDKSVRNQ